VVKARRSAFDSLCLLIARSLWLERNARVFNSLSRPAAVLDTAITDLGTLGCRARVVDRSKLLRD
jgi:hypothetical protein